MLNLTDLQSDQKNHTIPLLDVVSLDENISAIIMPIFRPLSAWIVTTYQSDQSSNFSLAKQLLEGVNFLHERNIAHLDIKPDNLVIDVHSSRLAIIDFGLAKKLESTRFNGNRCNFTSSWRLLGDAKKVAIKRVIQALNKREDGCRISWNQGYAALEIEDEEVYNSFQADIWSVGTVIGELLREYSYAETRTTLGSLTSY